MAGHCWKRDPQSDRRARATYLALLIAYAVLLNGVVAIYLSQQLTWASFVHLLFAELIHLGIAHQLAQWTLALIAGDGDPPMLDVPLSDPEVAVLYVTCDDLIPDRAQGLRHLSYPRARVFVLDDSMSAVARRKVDELGLPVFRRPDRRGFKAGNINNWLASINAEFDYFVVLDNDSIVPSDFIEQMLCYAEHPANADVAIFQSRVRLSDGEPPFALALESLLPARDFLARRVHNRLRSLLPTTNFLIRTSVARTIGGMDASTLTEDYATGVRIYAEGWRCQRIDVTSWVSGSATIRQHVGRLTRWASGLLQIVRKGISELPLILQVELLMGLYSYLIWPVCFMGLAFALFSSSSSSSEFQLLAHLAVTGQLFEGPFRYWLFLLCCYAGYFFLLNPILARVAGVRLKAYLAHLFVNTAVSMVAVEALLGGQLAVLVGRRPHWRQPRSNEHSSRDLAAPLVVLAFLLAAVCYNPLGVVLHLLWLGPLILSALVLLAVRHRRF